jgi:hypothetical protein
MHRLVRATVESEPVRPDEVVVARDAHGVALAQELGAFIGVRVVADDVADAKKACHTPRVERIEHRDERLAVAVDVA